jgi:hypothetical protein
MGYVYKIRFNNNTIYIGYTTDLDARLKSHKISYKDDSLKIEVIKEVLDNRGIYWEQYFINHYKLLGEKLINITVGGNGIHNLQEEFKVTEKIQVLISQQDMADVNSLLMLEALETSGRPLTLSSFARELIKKYIEDDRHKLEQRSHVKDNVGRYLNAIKQEKEPNNSK